MKKSILIIFLFLNCCLSFSQQLFENVYRKSTGDRMIIRAFDASSNGNCYAVGTVLTDNTSNVIKIDSVGNIIWEKQYSSTAWMLFTLIVSMPDGGFAAAGYYGDDFCLLRGDSAGNTIWAWRYNFIGPEEVFNTIVRTPDNGFILSGLHWHITQPFIVRVDSSGNIIYSKRFLENQNYTAIEEIKMSADGNYFAMLGSGDYPRVRVMKFDVNGNQIWSVGVGDTTSGTITVHGSTFCSTRDGGCLIGGVIYDSQVTSKGFSICKISSQGTIEWIRALISATNEVNDLAFVINTSENGFMIVSINYDSLILSHVELRLTKTDSLGHFLWTKKYSPNLAGVSHVIENTDHGFTVATSNFMQGGWDLLLFNTDSLGTTLCENTFVSQADSTIMLPPFQPVYSEMFLTLTKDTMSFTVDSGMIVLDYCQLLSVPEEIRITGISVFPNPFHLSATFQIYNKKLKTSKCELRIYNTLGILIRSEQIPNITSYILHRGGLNDGLYFYEVLTPDYELIGTGKFVVE